MQASQTRDSSVKAVRNVLGQPLTAHLFKWTIH